MLEVSRVEENANFILFRCVLKKTQCLSRVFDTRETYCVFSRTQLKSMKLAYIPNAGNFHKLEV